MNTDSRTTTRLRTNRARAHGIARFCLAALATLCISTLVHGQTTFQVVKQLDSPVYGASPRAAVIQTSDGRLYGTTSEGGANNLGTVFQVDPAGTLTTVHDFAGGSDGAAPYAGLTQGADGNLYGTTWSGGTSDRGTIFRLESDPFEGGWQIQVLAHFTGGSDGGRPYAGLIQGADGSFYGTAAEGGLGYGTVFKLTGGTLTTLHSFTGGSDGWYPIAALVQGADGSFYGSTEIGGIGSGTIFKIDAAGALTTVHAFSGAGGGGRPWGTLIQGTDGSFYGTTSAGASGHGSVFRIDGAGAFTTLFLFNGGTDGGSPFAGVIQAADGNFYGTTSRGASGYGTVFRITGVGSLTTLHRFSGGSDGGAPLAALLQTANGNFGGTTFGGGAPGAGTVFTIDSAGALTSLHRFIGGTGGARPYAGLLQVADGSFYGAASSGGAAGRGTVFKLEADGTLTVIHTFTGGSDGDQPWSTVIQAADGNIYGTTLQGGTGYGTVYRIDGAGALTTVHRFTGGSDGWAPVGGLVQAADGRVYGTTQIGGAIGSGTIFRIEASGTLTTVHSFGGAGGGGRPSGALIQSVDGSLYGTTSAGNTGHGTVFKLDTAGTFTTIYAFNGGTNGGSPFAGLIQASDGSVYGTTTRGGTGNGTAFKVDTSGILTTLHRFNGTSDGGAPLGALLQASDGGLYGTTSYGGSAGVGTIFKLGLAGPLATLHSFVRSSDGATPFAGLVQASDGALYGTTSEGGTAGAGTIFKLIIPFNHAPVADSQSVQTGHNTAAAITLTGSDADGDALAFTIVTQPAHGSLSGTAPDVTYTPTAGYSGADSFTFKVSDGSADSNVATVTIDVAPAPLAVTLTEPNGGEKVFANVPYDIRWTAASANAFDAALSRDGGVTYTAIAACSNLPGTATSCTWTPTTPSSTNALIRVTARDAGTGTATDASDATFTISGGTPSINVTSPNTGVQWPIGSPRLITWNHNLGTNSAVRIELTRDNGSSWEILAGSVTNNAASSGSYSWLVSGPSTSGAMVRVTWVDGPTSDTSSVPFSIGAPAVTVTSPNTNVNWLIGSVHDIRWSHNLGTAETARIELSRDNGATWTLLAANAPNTAATSGRFSWTVTGPVTAQAIIRVSRASDTAIQDTSDVPFRVGSKITLTTPNTAVTWAAGSTRTIIWNHSYGPAQSFDIHVSTDNGVTWAPWASAVPAASASTGTYTAALPNSTSTQARMHVSPTGTFGDGDTSNVPFTLAAPVITMTSPNTNVRWTIGSARSITWTHNLGQLETVNIEVSRNGGTTWTTLAAGVANTANASGTYSWMVTGPATTTARIRVTWTTNATVQGMSNTDFRIE